MAIALLAGQTTNASGTATALSARPDVNRFGVSAFGTFGGGTITVEFAVDGTNYVPVTTFTAAGYKVIDVFSESNSKLRATLSGATGANVNCQMSGAFTGIARTDA